MNSVRQSTSPQLGRCGTIRERFNTYRFADYKEKVIDLLRRVTRVSVETMQIVEAMRAAPR